MLFDTASVICLCQTIPLGAFEFQAVPPEEHFEAAPFLHCSADASKVRGYSGKSLEESIFKSLFHHPIIKPLVFSEGYDDETKQLDHVHRTVRTV
jgi:hypothetical protein